MFPALVKGSHFQSPHAGGALRDGHEPPEVRSAFGDPAIFEAVTDGDSSL